MTDPQKFNGGEYAGKARDAAQEHPEQTRGAIDKAQAEVNKRTGGKFGSLIEKAGDFVEDKLGLPEEKADDATPAPKADDASPAPKQDSTPAPKQDSAPSQTGQADSTGGGVLPG